MREASAVLGLVYNITNTYIVTKKQFVRALVNEYESQVAERQKAVGVFKYRLDLRKISPPFSPIVELQQKLCEKITPNPRTMILLTPLIQSIRGFEHTANQRNEWIEEIRVMPPEQRCDMKCAMFFGFPYAPGRIDDRYP